VNPVGLTHGPLCIRRAGCLGGQRGWVPVGGADTRGDGGLRVPRGQRGDLRKCSSRSPPPSSVPLLYISPWQSQFSQELKPEVHRVDLEFGSTLKLS
jgi:hypothetical protein